MMMMGQCGLYSSSFGIFKKLITCSVFVQCAGFGLWLFLGAGGAVVFVVGVRVSVSVLKGVPKIPQNKQTSKQRNKHTNTQTDKLLND